MYNVIIAKIIVFCMMERTHTRVFRIVKETKHYLPQEKARISWQQSTQQTRRIPEEIISRIRTGARADPTEGDNLKMKNPGIKAAAEGRVVYNFGILPIVQIWHLAGLKLL